MTDLRDQRDPEWLGTALLGGVARHGSLAAAYDAGAAAGCPDYLEVRPDEVNPNLHPPDARERRKELLRADDGLGFV